MAALSLPYKERVEALDDIAAMIGCTYAEVQSKASQIRARRHGEATEASGFERKAPFTKTQAMPVSGLLQPSKKQLMGSHSRLASRRQPD